MVEHRRQGLISFFGEAYPDPALIVTVDLAPQETRTFELVDPPDRAGRAVAG
jgi:hypothetical protein